MKNNMIMPHFFISLNSTAVRNELKIIIKIERITKPSLIEYTKLTFCEKALNSTKNIEKTKKYNRSVSNLIIITLFTFQTMTFLEEFY